MPGWGQTGLGTDRAGDAPGRADSVLPSAGGWEAEPRVPPPAAGSPQGQQHGPGPPSPAQQWGCSRGAERTERNPISAAALPGAGAPIALFMSIRNSIKASDLIVFCFKSAAAAWLPAHLPTPQGPASVPGLGGSGGPCSDRPGQPQSRWVNTPKTTVPALPLPPRSLSGSRRAGCGAAAAGARRRLVPRSREASRGSRCLFLPLLLREQCNYLCRRITT